MPKTTSKKADKPWCHWQTKCKEDTRRGQWTCTANLAEGHAFRCRKRDMKHAKKAPGRCEDAEPYREEYVETCFDI